MNSLSPILKKLRFLGGSRPIPYQYAARRILFAACAAMVLTPAYLVSAQEEEYEAVTTVDVTIPTDELPFLLAPLTKEELQAEAEAWMEVLQAKVRETSAKELSIRRKNKEIEAAKDTEAAVKKAEKAAEKAAEAQSKAAASSDTGAQEKAQAAAEKAQQAAEEAERAAEEVQKAEERTSEVDTEAAADEPEAAPPAPPAPAAPAAPADEPTGEAETVTQAKVDDKAQRLEDVAQLKRERTAIVDRFDIVLNELEKKGGETEDYRTYMAAVSGVRIDTIDFWDTMATWASVKAWLTSDELGKRLGWNVFKFAMTLLVFWILSIIVGRAIDRGLRVTKRLSILLRNFISSTVRRVVLGIGLIVALAAFGVKVGPLMAIIGAAGFIIAFALQDTLSNFASGIMILLYRPFDEGDVVDVAGVNGKVDSLNLVNVTIKTFDNQVVIVPNNSVWGGIITNVSGSKTRRVDMVFGIGYDDDISKAQRILEEIVSSHELVLNDPEYTIKLNELADSSVNFICRPWVKTPDYWTVYWDITRAVKERFDQEGITIPYPQRDVHVVESPAPEPVA